MKRIDFLSIKNERNDLPENAPIKNSSDIILVTILSKRLNFRQNHYD